MVCWCWSLERGSADPANRQSDLARGAEVNGDRFGVGDGELGGFADLLEIVK